MASSAKDEQVDHVMCTVSVGLVLGLVLGLFDQTYFWLSWQPICCTLIYYLYGFLLFVAAFVCL